MIPIQLRNVAMQQLTMTTFNEDLSLVSVMQPKMANQRYSDIKSVNNLKGPSHIDIDITANDILDGSIN